MIRIVLVVFLAVSLTPERTNAQKDLVLRTRVEPVAVEIQHMTGDSTAVTKKSGTDLFRASVTPSVRSQSTKVDPAESIRLGKGLPRFRDSLIILPARLPERFSRRARGMLEYFKPSRWKDAGRSQ